MVNGKKILAMFLIFTLTISHFAVVTKSIATTSFVSLFGTDSNNDNENVEFKAYLASGEETAEALVSDVNNQELAIKLQLNVKENGYLKNGKVEIKAKEEEQLNFAIKEENAVAEIENVQSLQDNVLEFNKIDSSSDELEISIPIEYEMEEYINEAKLRSTAQVILSGIYVDDEGKENEISKEIELTLAWKDNRTVKIEEEVSKYIQFGNNGVILQTIVKVDGSSENQSSLPTKETQLNINVPKINDMAPTEVNVIANATTGTNGKGVGEVEFTNENWAYHPEEGTININLKNEKQLVEINQSEEYLKVEGEEIEQEERYHSVAGVDEYVVTYTFQNVSISDEIQTSSSMEAKMVTFSGVGADNGENVVTTKKEGDITLSGQTGNIVSYNVENKTQEISKIYGYLNKEVEYDSKTSINISSVDMVEEIWIEDVENNYIDKSGNKTQTEDIYYKQISISQENFNQILGEEGNIQIFDISNNELATINKESATDENGNYVINFESKFSKIKIKVSAPISTGNLIIASKKETSSRTISKNEYANMESIATTTVQKAKFTYVSELAELVSCTTKTKLKDTVTDFNLILDRDSLSTVTTNADVEIRLELNNNKETSDLYGNSIFEVEMPEYITNLKVTNASMIYGEGLEISNVETYVKNDRIFIRINVTGNQTALNSGALTNGANIVLNADIDIDMYAPSLDTAIQAYCYNSEATNYVDAVEYAIGNSNIAAHKEAKIQYSAPSGVVAINTISNYNQEGSRLTSIKQGKQTDYIDVYAEAKNATMEIAVINNNENTIENMSILGRIPFEGVKDLTTGDDLGTTLDTKMVSPITSYEKNNGEFTIYYSQNEEATKDLQDSSNGWTTNPESLDNVKSYLIVSNGENPVMEAKQILKFTYQYEIPANLKHNENIYGTFLVSYTNNGVSEEVKPDLVGLSTGVGPELELTLKTDVETVKENDKINITTTIKNVGQDVAQDVLVKLPIPENTTFVLAEADKDIAKVMFADGSVVTSIENLAKDASIDIKVTVKVGKINSEKTVNTSATVTAKNLKVEMASNEVGIKFQTGELRVYQFIDSEIPQSYYYKKGETLKINVGIENPSRITAQKNITVVTTLPKEIEFTKAYMVERDKDGNYSNIENATYDASTNQVTWTIDNIEADRGKTLALYVKPGDLQEGTLGNTVHVKTKAFAEATETYQAEDIIINIGKSSISITQTSTTSTYVPEGQLINYTFLIKNEGPKAAEDVVLTDNIPEGVIVKRITYEVNGIKSTRTMADKGKTMVTLSIPSKEEVAVEVTALASNLKGEKEKTITNVGSISGSNMADVTSNSVTHIIQATEKNQSTEDDTIPNKGTTDTSNNSNSNTDITKSYKITGVAWLDTNKNGMRDDGEQRMSNVTAMLVDSTSGVIKATMKTNARGEYAFTGLRNGAYLVLFKYDTTLYTTTTYRKEGIQSSINSDVVTTKIEQDGKKENGAVTDVININGASVSNIDIGLVESAQFSLGLDKSLTKVTVQNAQGTVTEEFDKVKLAQYGIAAKYLTGTTVYVEYTITVTNNGDLAGFASEIVDYIPQGMTFNSNLNPDWYTGTDGNLYTKALANVELTAGQSKDIKLVLTRQMTAENTKMVSNSAEIAEDFNIYGVSDKNSTPANKAQGEDDMSTADIILTIKTGETLIYLSAIIISILIGGAVAFVVYEKVGKNKRKGGN